MAASRRSSSSGLTAGALRGVVAMDDEAGGAYSILEGRRETSAGGGVLLNTCTSHLHTPFSSDTSLSTGLIAACFSAGTWPLNTSNSFSPAGVRQGQGQGREATTGPHLSVRPYPGNGSDGVLLEVELAGDGRADPEPTLVGGSGRIRLEKPTIR